MDSMENDSFGLLETGGDNDGDDDDVESDEACSIRRRLRWANSSGGNMSGFSGMNVGGAM